MTNQQWLSVVPARMAAAYINKDCPPNEKFDTEDCANGSINGKCFLCWEKWLGEQCSNEQLALIYLTNR